MEPPTCPHCGCELFPMNNIYFDWECYTCDRTYNSKMSEEIHTPLTLATIWPKSDPAPTTHK